MAWHPSHISFTHIQIKLATTRNKEHEKYNAMLDVATMAYSPVLCNTSNVYETLTRPYL
jgi:hypothetical protein